MYKFTDAKLKDDLGSKFSFSVASHFFVIQIYMYRNLKV